MTVAGVAVLSPEGDFDHPWVQGFLSGLRGHLDTAYFPVGLTDGELDGLCSGLASLPSDVRAFHAQRCRAAATIRSQRAAEALRELPRDWTVLQIYTNDVLPTHEVQYVFTDVFLATLAAHAAEIPGYWWEPRSLRDALARELAILHAARRIFIPTDWLYKWGTHNLPADIVAKLCVVGWGPGVDLQAIGARRLADGNSTRAGNTLLFVGNAVDRKGLGVLLEAHRLARQRIETLHLTIVGEVTAPSRPVQGVTVTGHLRLDVPSERAELIGAYSSADIFVMPSSFEPVGCSYIEAMAAALPVIARPVCAVPEILGTECGWLVGKEPEALADAIVEAVCSRSERARRGAAGHHRAATRYTWGRGTKIVADVIATGA